MENRIPEFDGYLSALSEALNTNTEINKCICMEISQNLYDKYNEYLIKGYGLKNSVQYTIRTFENPVKLAKMFNKIYKEENVMPDVKKIIYNKGIIISSFIIIFLMTVYGFVFSLYNFVLLAGKDYGSLGWHAIDSNVINSLLLSTTLLVLYVGCLYNIIFKKLLPPKIIIWTAYINFFLVMLFNFATK
ncbi:MAG: hypothetical protein Q8942_14720 [Bacillota bacterium]|nr:hypothetical protein [Bacillota bacterium]